MGATGGIPQGYGLLRGFAILVVLVVVTALLGAFLGRAPEPVVLARIDTAAFAVTPGGAIVAGDRLSGQIIRIADPTAASGRVRRLATVAVSTPGEQGGLIGLTVDRSGRVFVSFTALGSERLTVARVEGGRSIPVWRGPRAADRANGGHLAVAPDGALVLGVGTMQDPEAVGDPRSVKGKLLRLDPDGEPGQRPTVISTGWSNPFAFAFAPDGVLWVADNSGGDAPERIALGNAGPRPEVIGVLPDRTAPSGLAILADGTLGICSYLRGTLLRWVPGEPARTTDLHAPCDTGVIVLPNGSLVTAVPGKLVLSPAPDLR